MANPITLSAFVLTTLLSSALSIGIPIIVSPGLNVSSNPNVTANLPSCTNLTYAYAPNIPCYTKLQESAYLENFNLTKAELCAPDQLWSTCLLQAVYLAPGVNCTMVTNITSTCIPFDCATLTSTTCPQPQSSNFTNITVDEAQQWYGGWNIYSLHTFIASWALALNATSSEPAILSVINPSVATRAVTVLEALIAKYGVNPNADSALIELVNVTTVSPQAVYGGRNLEAKGQVQRHEPSGTEWRLILAAKLQYVADQVMGNFTDFLAAVEEGAFNTRGLANATVLAERMAQNETREGL
ncbi:hypothetical protein JMJ35_003180 [Cladonia borealis]|uniref:Uncharacterized protein n=1 Tax=Cladonia borealis TaxID=184061 RepID=A0AA39R477_9LECA|nr:hypothetical protein JMJ35_003180 [Cladonia borealis]